MIDQCAKTLATHGEAALIRFIFKQLGTATRYCVEFGAKGRGPTWDLRHSLEWQALLIDANAEPDSQIIRANVTAENINDLFAAYHVPTNFDFLCIDIDGNDFWVWKALDNTRFSPRVVCIEYNCFFPPDVAVTVPYDPDRVYKNDRYYGASAAALYKLASGMGYSLICVEGFINLFFVRNDLLATNEQNIPLSRLFHHPVDIEAFAKQQGYTWRPSWINAPPPDFNAEKWVLV